MADVPTGSCEDVPFLPVDAVKMRIGKTAAPRGITEVSDSVATLVSHSVEVNTILYAHHSCVCSLALCSSNIRLSTSL